MDADRFDQLARSFWSIASRRRTLRGAAVGAIAALGRLGLGSAQNQDSCKIEFESCGAGKECCSLLCNGECICRRQGERCAVHANCCDGGRCIGNRCGCRDDDDCPFNDRCCKSKGVCFVRGERECGSDPHCGIGNRCEECERCVCDPTKCAKSDLEGCCPPRQPGDSTFCQFGEGSAETPDKRFIYCGKPGETCRLCDKAKGQRCDPATRRCVCDKATCKRRNGCCHATSKTCKTGTARTACGKEGKPCQNCQAKGEDWICQDKRCCVKDGGDCPTACPADGPCPQCCGGQCAGGTCDASCAPGSCPTGCCDPATKTCQPGTTNQACDAGLGACETCDPTEMCNRTSASGPHRCCTKSNACPTQCCDSGSRCCGDETGEDICCHAGWKCCPRKSENGSGYCCTFNDFPPLEDIVCCASGSRGPCCRVGQACCPEDAVRDCCDAVDSPGCCYTF